MTEAAIRRAAAAWATEGRVALVVEVIEAQGSTPRERGTRMVVSAEEVLGSIGGGHLELKAIAEAREALARGALHCTERRYALGPSLGQCCGGAMTLRREPLGAQALARWPAPEPRFHLQLHGAGHVGRAIARLLEGIDCRVQWVDEREAEFPPGASAPHIERICAEPVPAEVDTAPPDACFLVLTHSHDLDLAIVERVLRRGDFRFLGLIGSATKRARFEHRLQDRGVPAERIARMACPIGVPGIEGKSPEVIAVAAVAQLLQL